MGSSVILPPTGQPKQGPDPAFRTPALPNLVQFKFQHVDPPSSLYMQRDDALQLEVASQIASESVIFTARILQPYNVAPGQPDNPPTEGSGAFTPGPGIVTLVREVVPVAAARTGSPLIVRPLQEGYLLSLAVSAQQAVARGQTFVRAFISRLGSSVTSPSSVLPLLAGYVTQTHPLGWPGGGIAAPTDGAGLLVRYSPANPAAGADFTFTTNAPGRVRIACVQAQLVTSAAAGNRFPAFKFTVPGTAGCLYSVQDTVAVPASTTVTYSLAPGGTNVRGAGAPLFVTLPIPSPALFFSSATVASSTQGILGGDQWSAIEVDTEEWLDIF